LADPGAGEPAAKGVSTVGEAGLPNNLAVFPIPFFFGLSIIFSDAIQCIAYKFQSLFDGSVVWTKPDE
jgi:hypothetical protein